MATRDAYVLCTDSRFSLEFLISQSLLLDNEICIITDEGNQIGRVENGVLINTGQDGTHLEGQPAAYYLDRANHTGTQLAATITDFDTAVEASPAVSANTIAQVPTGVWKVKH